MSYARLSCSRWPSVRRSGKKLRIFLDTDDPFRDDGIVFVWCGRGNVCVDRNVAVTSKLGAWQG